MYRAVRNETTMWEGDVWVAARAARAGADVVQEGFRAILQTEMKGAVNPVTQIDRYAETAIMETIATYFPDDHLLGEEGGGSDWRRGRVWIVDPLDGTVNFVHGIPQVAVSVALWSDGTPLVGVIIDVARNDEYIALAGAGATLNEEPIMVSTTPVLAEAMVLTGFPYDRRDHSDAYLEMTRSFMISSQAVRVLGSAALDLAWVASGRADIYCEHGGPNGVKPWDLAAGMLLVTEAGGTVTDQDDQLFNLEPTVVVASNGLLHDDVRHIAKNTLPGHFQ